MTPETLNLLYMAAVFLGGLWLEHWQGPLATLLRKFWPKPSPGPAPVPDGTPAPSPSPVPNALDWLKRMIPDDPDSEWDDVARSVLDALAQRVKTAAPEKKLSVVRRLLDLAERMDEPAALTT